MQLRLSPVFGVIALLAAGALARQSTTSFRQGALHTPLRYRVTALSGLPGGQNSQAVAINDRGQIIGQANANGSAHAVLWDKDALIDIGVLPDNEISFGRGLNSRGDVTGRSEGGRRATFPAIVWNQREGLRELPLLPGGRDGYAYAVNDAGQMVGWSAGPGARVAVLWDTEGVHSLASARYAIQDSSAYAINATGQIVGYTFVEEKPNRPARTPSAGNYFISYYAHAFLWQRGAAIDLGTPSGFKNSTATAIANTGEITGYAVRSTEDRSTRAFVWQEGRMRLLPTPLDQHSRANGINDHGWIVGYVGDFREQAQSFAWKTRAALWQNDRLIDLNTLLPDDSGWLLTEAYGINNRGQIVGVGRWKGDRRAFLLTPSR